MSFKIILKRDFNSKHYNILKTNNEEEYGNFDKSISNKFSNMTLKRYLFFLLLIFKV